MVIGFNPPLPPVAAAPTAPAAEKVFEPVLMIPWSVYVFRLRLSRLCCAGLFCVR